MGGPSETQAAAALILLGQARRIMPEYPNSATATQVLVVGILLEQASLLLTVPE